MKSLQVHYKNKYPGGDVEMSDDKLDVYDSEGQRRLSLRKNGGGAMVDVSEELGLPDRHDLSPLPKQSRLFKVRDEKIVKDELYSQRVEKLERYCDESGRVMSCEELQKAGKMRFDKDQNEM